MQKYKIFCDRIFFICTALRASLIIISDWFNFYELSSDTPILKKKKNSPTVTVVIPLI